METDESELARRLRKAEKRVAALERERDELASYKPRALELEKECAQLKQRMDQLRDSLGELRTAQREAAALGPGAPVKTAKEPQSSPAPKPLVEPPSHSLARQRRQSSGSRVGIFLDVANLSGAGRRLFAGAVDFRKLLGVLVGPRVLVEARAYVIDKGKDGFEGFARALRAAGYRVFTKKPKVFPDGTMKADWDLGMAVDLLTSADRYDVIVLGTGDGDFVPVVTALRARGQRVEVASFGDRTASELVRAGDDFIELDASVLE